jgi:tetratricopeptide (TPR) repeat protein
MGRGKLPAEAIATFWTLVQVLLTSSFVRKARQTGEAIGAAARKARSPAGRAKPGERRGGAAAAKLRGAKKPPPSQTRATKAASRAPAKPRTKVPSPRRSHTRAVAPQPGLSPEELLQRAMAAPTARARAIWARRGLASVRRIDRTTQSMLLRQLYLAYYERRRFAKALEVSEQNLHLDVLPDVVHQDAARAAHALGDVEAAVGHLRLAARVGPAKRRAFHWWTLGSVYFLAGRYDDAVSALTRAARWGTTDKPLYQGHLAVARCASGEQVPELPALLERLAEVPAGQGYGRFVLGHLAYYGRRWDDARRYLQAFVKRSQSGRAAVAIALDGEIELARKTLARLEKEKG